MMVLNPLTAKAPFALVVMCCPGVSDSFPSWTVLTVGVALN